MIIATECNSAVIDTDRWRVFIALLVKAEHHLHREHNNKESRVCLK